MEFRNKIRNWEVDHVRPWRQPLSASFGGCTRREQPRALGDWEGLLPRPAAFRGLQAWASADGLCGEPRAGEQVGGVNCHRRGAEESLPRLSVSHCLSYSLSLSLSLCDSVSVLLSPSVCLSVSLCVSVSLSSVF